MRRENHRLGVTALGEPLVEFAEIPRRANDQHEAHYRRGFGGDTSNLVIAAARAGASAAYLTRLGADDFGADLLRLWQREGVDAQAVESDSAASTGVYFVHRRGENHEFSYLRRNSAAAQMTPEWLKTPLVAERLRQSRYFHVSGISAAISASARATVFAAVETVKAASCTVSFDPNLRLKLWSLSEAREVITRLIGLADLFLPSLEDMETLLKLSNPRQIIDWSHQQGAKLVILKCGRNGALISTRLGAELITVPAVSVAVVDSTGAGDCFCGTLLARLSAGDDPARATELANRAAALTVSKIGAV
ncbi:MAG: sugar kinase [Alphaproteobacteria bacterium]|nr:sugar kinase [Alphaproteobacteria bacterium]